jgi:competence protein ComEA
MVKKIENRLVRLDWFSFYMTFAVIVLISMVLAAYAQTQKPVIDLNTASKKELETLKGVGPATAEKIVEGRPYSSVDDLSRAGVPAKKIKGIKPIVTVGRQPSTSAGSSREQPKVEARISPKTAPSLSADAKIHETRNR